MATLAILRAEPLGCSLLGPCKEATFPGAASAVLCCTTSCLYNHFLLFPVSHCVKCRVQSTKQHCWPGLVMLLQDEPRQHYILAAAVQEVPAGHAMFFHRMSASAKFNLESPSYLHTTHLTARPLKSAEYAPIMVTEPLWDDRRAQWSARWPAEAFDATIAQRCAPHSTALACMQHLHISRPAQWATIGQGGASVPVLPVSFWFNIEHAINFSYTMFEHIRSHQNFSSKLDVRPRPHFRFSARWKLGL